VFGESHGLHGSHRAAGIYAKLLCHLSAYVSDVRNGVATWQLRQFPAENAEKQFEPFERFESFLDFAEAGNAGLADEEFGPWQLRRGEHQSDSVSVGQTGGPSPVQGMAS
jgi:hypothetical protein